MVKCPRCGAELEIWDCESTICNECGYEWDLQDEDFAKHRLIEGMKKIYPQCDEGSIVLDVERILEEAEASKIKAEWYDKIKEKLNEFISDAYHNFMQITPKNQDFLHDLAFSIYNEKNFSKRIQIYPKSVS